MSKPAVYRREGEFEPMGGWMCECGQRRGAHNTTRQGQPSLDGRCPGFREVPGQRVPADPHKGHQQSLYYAWAHCRDECYPKLHTKMRLSRDVHTRNAAEQFARNHAKPPEALGGGA